MQRLTLAKLGYRSPADEMDAEKAVCFCLISSEIDKLMDEERKKQAKKRG